MLLHTLQSNTLSFTTHIQRKDQRMEWTSVCTVGSHKCPLLIYHTLGRQSSNGVIPKQICSTGFHKNTRAAINTVHHLAIPPPSNSLNYIKVDCSRKVQSLRWCENGVLKVVEVEWVYAGREEGMVDQSHSYSQELCPAHASLPMH